MLLTHESWIAKPTGVYFLVIWCPTPSRCFESGLSTSRCKTPLLGQITAYIPKPCFLLPHCALGILRLPLCIVSVILCPILALQAGLDCPATSIQQLCLALPLNVTHLSLFFFLVLEIKLRALRMIDKCSTTELHQDPCPIPFKTFHIYCLPLQKSTLRVLGFIRLTERKHVILRAVVIFYFIPMVSLRLSN